MKRTVVLTVIRYRRSLKQSLCPEHLKNYKKKILLKCPLRMFFFMVPPQLNTFRTSCNVSKISLLRADKIPENIQRFKIFALIPSFMYSPFHEFQPLFSLKQVNMTPKKGVRVPIPKSESGSTTRKQMSSVTSLFNTVFIRLNHFFQLVQ